MSRSRFRFLKSTRAQFIRPYKRQPLSVYLIEPNGHDDIYSVELSYNAKRREMIGVGRAKLFSYPRSFGLVFCCRVAPYYRTHRVY